MRYTSTSVFSTAMFNPFEAAQGGGGDDKTFLGENQPHRPTTGALRYSDDTELCV